MDRRYRLLIVLIILLILLAQALLLGMSIGLAERVEALELKPCLLSSAHYHDR